MSDPIPDIPLPKGWPRLVKSALLHVFSLAHYALISARGWAADGLNPRARHASEVDRLPYLSCIRCHICSPTNGLIHCSKERIFAINA